MKHYIIVFLFLCLTNINAQVEGDLLGRWTDSTLVASSAHNNTYNEVWGLEVNGSEIAVLGTTRGTHFIDVTDPMNPEELFVVDGGSQGTQIIHRDFHDFQGYLYSIADEGANTGLQIIDTRFLPDSISVVYDSQEYFTRSHNIFIDSSKARLYALISSGTSLPYRPMRIFDISDPINPLPIGAYNSFNDYSISQVHDAYVQNDTAYLNLGPDGFAIIDFADVDNPIVLGLLERGDYPDSGYNHSGWLTEDGDYYYMADENFDHDIKVLDVRELPDIDVVSTFNALSDEPSITHNQIVLGDKLYVSYYFDGLVVYDISDRINPEILMYYDTSDEVPVPGTYRGAWGVYPFLSSGNILVSDMQNGLFVIDGEIPTSTSDYTEDAGFAISPNPSEGMIQVTIDEGVNATEVLVINVTGKIVYRSQGIHASTQLDLSHLPGGMYHVVVKSEEKLSTQKLVLK